MADNFFFARKMPCILHCSAKKISSMFSRLVRDLVQKAKWSEIFRRSRIQAVPTISKNLCTECLTLKITILLITMIIILILMMMMKGAAWSSRVFSHRSMLGCLYFGESHQQTYHNYERCHGGDDHQNHNADDDNDEYL